jgi:hypothetical protein
VQEITAEDLAAGMALNVVGLAVATSVALPALH